MTLGIKFNMFSTAEMHSVIGLLLTSLTSCHTTLPLTQGALASFQVLEPCAFLPQGFMSSVLCSKHTYLNSNYL
jgi:hypothetical protein